MLFLAAATYFALANLSPIPLHAGNNPIRNIAGDGVSVSPVSTHGTDLRL